jgi:hypothetical protein
MGEIRRFVIASAVGMSALALSAQAHDPLGPGTGLPSFASLDLAGFQPSIESAHGSGHAFESLNGPSTAASLERVPGRTAFAISLRYALTPWMTLDFAGGILRADDQGNPLYTGTRVFDQAGATLHGGRTWNASLFVNYFRMDAATQDQGVQASNASFVNGRVNLNLTRRMGLSFDLLNAFDKRVAGIDTLASPRLWSEPLISENVLFDASEARTFRLRLHRVF